MEINEEDLKDLEEIQKKIQEQINFLQENAESLTEEQLENLFNVARAAEESMGPDVNKMRKSLEDIKKELGIKDQE